MTKRVLVLTALSALFVPASIRAQDPPDTDIWVADLRLGAGTAELGGGRNATDRPGYDNQPWFTSDGSGFYYARWDGVETDVFLYDLAAEESTQVTATPWGEYSPSPVGDSGDIYAVGGGGDPLEMGLWRYSAAGEPVEPLLIRTVGYYGIYDDAHLFAWLNDGNGTIVHVDRTDGTVTPFRDGAAPGPQRLIPGEPAMAFLERDAEGRMTFMRLDPETRGVTPMFAAAGDGRDFVFTPDGRILMGDGNAIFIRALDPEDEWVEVARFPELAAITRLAVSPAGDRVAFVAMAR